ncbi:MAG: pentapeptide repeat-containing protein [Rubrobacter sp.]|nr:pentapeptide repeat-containing protein [Rubrobacter sp.]
MMLDDKNPLLESEPDTAVGLTARVNTVAVLNRLDGHHNEIVVDFLKESGLSGYKIPGVRRETVVRLNTSSLNYADLSHNNLNGFNLRFTDLRSTDLRNANLGLANLTFADLDHANLRGANLRDADLIFANLENADLEDANFSGARLRGVDLSGADLKEATNLSQLQINQAGAGSTGTRVPDNREKPNWWSKPNVTIDPPAKDPFAYPRLQDDRLGASLVPLSKNLRKEVGSEVGLPQDVGTSGALVYDVQPEGLAHAAGMKPGDIIVEVEGRETQGLEDLKGTVHKNLYEDNDRLVEFTIRRWFYVEQGWPQGVLSANITDQ